MSEMKKSTLAGAAQWGYVQDNYNRYGYTFQIRNDGLTAAQINREIERNRRARRREAIARTLRYAGGFTLMAIVWIVMTGL